MGTGGTSVETMLTDITWQVVTHVASSVPFDFCISNLRAITAQRADVPAPEPPLSAPPARAGA
jgi:hypothetical protein